MLSFFNGEVIAFDDPKSYLHTLLGAWSWGALSYPEAIALLIAFSVYELQPGHDTPATVRGNFLEYAVGAVIGAMTRTK